MVINQKSTDSRPNVEKAEIFRCNEIACDFAATGDYFFRNRTLEKVDIFVEVVFLKAHVRVFIFRQFDGSARNTRSLSHATKLLQTERGMVSYTVAKYRFSRKKII